MWRQKCCSSHAEKNIFRARDHLIYLRSVLERLQTRSPKQCSSAQLQQALAAQCQKQPWHSSSKPPPRLMYIQGIQGLQTSHSMAQFLFLFHLTGFGRSHLQPISRDKGLISVPCSQQKAYSTTSGKISRPNHMTV